LKVTYTEEAVADIVEAIVYLNQRNPIARIPRFISMRERTPDRSAQSFEQVVSSRRLGSPSSRMPFIVQTPQRRYTSCIRADVRQ